MPVATYYASKYFVDNNTPLQTVPILKPGTVGVWEDTISLAANAQLIADDILKLVRLPGGHRPLRIEFHGPEWDSGAALRANFGTTANPDLFAAALDIDTAGGHILPAAADILQSLNEATPSSAYDVQIVVTTAASGNVAAAGTAYFRVWYCAAANVYDPSDSPAVVTS